MTNRPPPTKKQWRGSGLVVLAICLSSAGVWSDDDIRVALGLAALGVIAFAYAFYRASTADK